MSAPHRGSHLHRTSAPCGGQYSARLQEAAWAEAERAGREVDELQAEAADLRRQLEVLQGQVRDMQVGAPHGAVLGVATPGGMPRRHLLCRLQ